MTSIDSIDMEALPKIQEAVVVNYEKYMTQNDYWLSDYLNELGYCPRRGMDIPDFDLKFEEGGDPVKYDLENAITLYQKLDISPELAANGAFWTVLAHHYIPYIRHRGGYAKKSKDEALKRLPKDVCFQEYPSRRNKRESWLCRLWTVASLTYNKGNTSDPYEYTKLVFGDQDLLNTILDREIFSNWNVTHAFLEIYKERKDAGNPITRLEHRDFQVFLEALTDIVVIETFTLEDLKQEFRKFLKWEEVHRKIRNDPESS